MKAVRIKSIRLALTGASLLGIFLLIQQVASVHSSNQQEEILRTKLYETKVQGIRLDETPLEEAIKLILDAASEENEDFRSVDLEFYDVPRDYPITLDMREADVTADDALRYSSLLCQTRYTVRGNEIWITPNHYDFRPKFIQFIENSWAYLKWKLENWRKIIKGPSAKSRDPFA